MVAATTRLCFTRISKPVLVLALALTLGVGLQFVHTATSRADGGNCGPGWTLQQYINGGCAYSDSRRFTQGENALLTIHVYIASSVPSSLTTYVLSGMGKWNISATSVRFYQTSTPCNGNYTDNCVLVVGSSTCPSAWAQGDSGNWSVTAFTCHPAGSIWTGLFAHEFGHVLGLAHNNYTTSTGVPALMKPGVLAVTSVQPVDASIETSIYPMPANCHTGC